jgi:hypothetical protein
MLTATPVLLTFDGRDVTDALPADDVSGYVLVVCPVCGTERDVRYPYCCEFAAIAVTESSASGH